MKKKILIGSIFVLALILLMPSIPAIQSNAVEEGFKQNFQEKLESINLKELKELSHDIKFRFHPILQIIYLMIFYRGMWGFTLMLISAHYERNFLVVHFPILYNRGELMYTRSENILSDFHNLYDIIGYPIFFLIQEILYRIGDIFHRNPK